MGVVLDFGTSIADGSTVVPVTFDTNGVSSVVPVVARSDTQYEGRSAPNPLNLYSDRIRVGVTAASCLAATWGDDLTDIGLVNYSGVQLYMQFRRYTTDNSGDVSLTDAVGMLSDGFVVIEGRSHGLSVSLGLCAGVPLNPSTGHGLSISKGLCAGVPLNPAVSHGISVSQGYSFGSTPGQYANYGLNISLGTAIGAGVNPGSSHGISVSLGESSGANLNPGSSEGSSVSMGLASGSEYIPPTSHGLTISKGLSAGVNLNPASSEGITVSKGLAAGGYQYDFASDLAGVTIMANSEAGTITQTGSVALLDTTANNTYLAGFYAQPFDATATGVWHLRVLNTNHNASGGNYVLMVADRAWDDTADYLAGQRAFGVLIFGSAHSTTPGDVRVLYFDTGGTAHYLQTDGTWTTVATTLDWNLADGDYFDLTITKDAVAETHTLTAAKNGTTIESDPIAYADILPSQGTDYYPVAIDPATGSSYRVEWDSYDYEGG